MPVNEEQTLNIACDNPACPGNDLNPNDRMGWLFINSEVYGQPTKQSVFCSYGCVAAASTKAAEDPEADGPFAEAKPIEPVGPVAPEKPFEPINEPKPEEKVQ